MITSAPIASIAFAELVRIIGCSADMGAERQIICPVSRQAKPAWAKNLSRYPAGMVNPDRIRPYQDIADRLRMAREAEGMSQREFAEEAGLRYTQYKNWESGAYRIGLDGALELRRRYGITLEYIYIGDVDSLPMSWRKEISSRLADTP